MTRAKKAPKVRYWKVLNTDGRSCHGGDFQWSLPTWDARKGWVPGEWTPMIENVVPCLSGYHVCRDGDLVRWLHERIYLCEVRGPVVEQSDKVVARSVRLLMPTPWDECSARLFAVECASEVLSLYEAQYPNDSRVSDCLEVAYRFALGDAGAAAGAAAWAAAWAVARAAARDAQTERLLWWLGVTP